MALSDTLTDAFEAFINIALKFLKENGIAVKEKKTKISLKEIIAEVKRV
jgi:hypothetical protein